MNGVHIRIWLLVSFTFAVMAIVIRAIWQIVVIPTPKTMLIFIPLILALLGVDALFAYLAIHPQKFKSPSFLLGITVALTAGLLAGVTHFVRFIISPQAEPGLSKVIGSFVLLSSVSVYLLVLWIVRSVWRDRKG